MPDFRTIVNYALRESGITQDDLTTGNFASPPDPILTRFKSWCQQAYEDIQTDRRDWEFMQATGVTLCSPKMEVYGAYSSATPDTDDFSLESFSLHHSTNPTFMTAESLTGTTDALVTAGTGEGELNVSSFTTGVDFLVEPGDLIVNDDGSVLCYFQRWGRYDLSQSAVIGRNTSADISEIKLDSVTIQDSTADAGQSYNSVTAQPLFFVSYGDWLRYNYNRPTRIGRPLYFTLSNEGRVEFYPPLDTTYNISFEYTRTPQTLSAHGDTPTYLPARFHNAIAWRAVMYWAEYEGNGQQYNRAKARYTKFETEMIRDLLPPVKVSYDARQW